MIDEHDAVAVLEDRLASRANDRAVSGEDLRPSTREGGRSGLVDVGTGDRRGSRDVNRVRAVQSVAALAPGSEKVVTERIDRVRWSLLRRSRWGDLLRAVLPNHWPLLGAVHGGRPRRDVGDTSAELFSRRRIDIYGKQERQGVVSVGAT